MYTAAKRNLDDMEESNEQNGIDTIKAEEYLICESCKIELPNEASMRQHLLGQRHKKLRSAEENKRRVEQKCGLFIKGYSLNSDRDKALAYFSEFGKIVWVHFDHSFLLLDYDDPASAKTVMCRTHHLGGQKLVIQYRQIRKQAQIQTPANEVNNDFVESLKEITNFEDQLRELGKNLQPSAHQQFPKYNKLCEDLFQVCRYAFPYCRIHPFGSTITGLGFRNSDVDVFISGVKRGNNDVPFLYRAKAMLINSQKFTNVLVIPQAKIPILKCIHVDTAIRCDINLRNMLGVCNSHLINYYLNLDDKLRKVMVLLKFWARMHKLTGQNHLLTNYSLNLMLIFFLQQGPFRIPSVLTLQRNPQFWNIQDGWNGGFEPTQFLSGELRDLPILKLLERFFSFYVEYDYGVDVVCPYLGESLKKQLFNEPERLPPCLSAYKQYVASGNQPLKVDAAVCVQDPFEHSRNTTPIVSSATLELFVGFCRLGKQICEENEGPVLHKLLTEAPPTATTLTVIANQSSRFAIPMRPGLKYIEEKVDLKAERHRAWFESVTGFTKIVLRDFFRFKVTEAGDPESKMKHKKADGQSDVYESMRVSLNCSCKLNLWQGRKSTARTNKPDQEETKKGIMEREMAITEQLCSVYREVAQVDDVVDFELSIEFCAVPPKATISVTKTAAYKNSFKSFAGFFSAKLPVWFKTYEQEQNEGL